MPIDTNYYLQNQLQQPLLRIFEPIMGEGKANSLFSQLHISPQDGGRQCWTVGSLRYLCCFLLLAAGAHTRAIKVSTPSVGGIASFTVKSRTCIGCRSVLNASQKVVCAHCAGKLDQLYMRQVERVREHEELFTRVWTQCQRCQGSLHQDVLCTSKDCPIFYRRTKVQKDLNEAQKALDDFSF